MPQPTPYERLYSLTGYAEDNPGNPYNAAQHDAEFDAVKENLDGLNTNIAIIQRDDGALKNGIVTPRSLSTATLNMIANWNVRGEWAAFTDYAVKDFVEFDGIGYLCLTAHTSTDFATQLALGYWLSIDVSMAALAASDGASLIGFIQNGTDAVASTVENELRRIWYPEQFGAVGNGVADDALAWGRLLTAVGTSNFSILGKPGAIYLIGATGIAISNKANGKIHGNGAKFKINAVASQAPAGLGSTAIFLDTNTNVDFAEWEIDGNGKASNVVGLKGNTSCAVDRNRISGGGLSGQVFALGNTSCRYTKNECKDGTGASRGLWLGNFASGQMEADIEVSGNIVKSMGATGIVGASVGGRIWGNHVESCAGSGIIFGGANGYASAKLAIFGNTCRSNSFHGIQSDVFYSTTADLPYGIAVTGNICDLNNGSGIFGTYVRGVSIKGNVCRDNNADASGTGHGIQIDELSGFSVCSNVCYDSRVGGSRTQTHGISIVAQINVNDIQNGAVSGNVCFNNSSNGISMSTVGAGNAIDNVAITGNVATSNGAIGIFIAEGVVASINAVTVTGNVCQGNTTADMRVDPLNTVVENNIYTTLSGGNSNGYVTFTDADTTPSVKGGRKTFRVANTGATVITQFDDGVNDQEIVIYATNGNTTITHNANIRLNGSANFVMASNNSLTLRRLNTVWIETGRGTAG